MTAHVSLLFLQCRVLTSSKGQPAKQTGSSFPLSFWGTGFLSSGWTATFRPWLTISRPMMKKEQGKGKEGASFFPKGPFTTRRGGQKGRKLLHEIRLLSFDGFEPCYQGRSAALQLKKTGWYPAWFSTGPDLTGINLSNLEWWPHMLLRKIPLVVELDPILESHNF